MDEIVRAVVNDIMNEINSLSPVADGDYIFIGEEDKAWT